MTAGILVWTYTLLLPSFADADLVGKEILTIGPFGITWLRPQHLLGLDLPPLVHGVLWSLSLNVISYVAFSLARAPSAIERLQANIFVPVERAPMTPSFRLWRLSVTVEGSLQPRVIWRGRTSRRSSFVARAHQPRTATK
jgi:hypothetical protein